MRSLLPILLGWWLLACGPTPSSGADAGDAGRSFDEACAEDATSQCQKLDACLNDAGVSARYHDLFTCLSRQKSACLVTSTAPRTGRTPDSVLACASARTTEACTDFFDNDPPTACLPPAGTTPEGSACAFSAQCSTAFCSVLRGAACGVCATAPAMGADCTATGQCGVGQLCVSQNDVAPGTFRCVTPGRDGSGCGKDSPCATGYGCVAPRVDGGVRPGTCALLGSSVGAACDPLSRTLPACDLERGLFCDTASRTCTEASYAGPGSPCGTLDGGTERTICSQASTCEGVSHGVGTCMQRALDGTTCDTALGPSCLAPARCLSPDGGTRGLCQLPTANCN